MKLTQQQKDDLASLIGEGVHTGLRKAIDSPQSSVAWRAIKDLPDGEWGIVIEFAMSGILPWLEELDSDTFISSIAAGTAPQDVVMRDRALDLLERLIRAVDNALWRAAVDDTMAFLKEVGR